MKFTSETLLEKTCTIINSDILAGEVCLPKSWKRKAKFSDKVGKYIFDNDFVWVNQNLAKTNDKIVIRKFNNSFENLLIVTDKTDSDIIGYKKSEQIEFTNESLLKKVFEIVHKEMSFNKSDFANVIIKNIKSNTKCSSYNSDEDVQVHIDICNKILKKSYTKDNVHNLEQEIASIILNYKSWLDKEEKDTEYTYENAGGWYDGEWKNENIKINDDECVIKRTYYLNNIDYDLFPVDIRLEVDTNKEDTEIIQFGLITD